MCVRCFLSQRTTPQFRQCGILWIQFLSNLGVSEDSQAWKQPPTMLSIFISFSSKTERRFSVLPDGVFLSEDCVGGTFWRRILGALGVWISHDSHKHTCLDSWPPADSTDWEGRDKMGPYREKEVTKSGPSRLGAEPHSLSALWFLTVHTLWPAASHTIVARPSLPCWTLSPWTVSHQTQPSSLKVFLLPSPLMWSSLGIWPQRQWK